MACWTRCTKRRHKPRAALLISPWDMGVEGQESGVSTATGGAGLNGGVTPDVAGHRAERALVFGGTAHIENKRLNWESQTRIAVARLSGARNENKTFVADPLPRGAMRIVFPY